jgi:biotin carboxyl carrier protein
MRGDWRDGERTRTVEVSAEGAGRYRVTVDGVALDFTAEPLEGGRLRLTTPDGIAVCEVTAAGARRFVRVANMDFVFERVLGGRRRGAGAGDGNLEAPMPGVVTRILVSVGDLVKKGQPLLAIEAMKMEHVIRAPRDGTVARLAARAGEMVQGGVALVELGE